MTGLEFPVGVQLHSRRPGRMALLAAPRTVVRYAQSASGRRSCQPLLFLETIFFSVLQMVVKGFGQAVCRGVVGRR